MFVCSKVGLLYCLTNGIRISLKVQYLYLFIFTLYSSAYKFTCSAQWAHCALFNTQCCSQDNLSHCSYVSLSRWRSLDASISNSFGIRPPALNMNHNWVRSFLKDSMSLSGCQINPIEVNFHLQKSLMKKEQGV